MSNGCKYCNGSGWVTDSIGHCITCGHCGGYVHGVYEYRSASSPAVKLAKFTSVADSGKREDFSTGSVRDTQDGKGRYDLIPWPIIHRLAIHFENGAKKYGDNNWTKGQPLSRYFSSGVRHATKWFLGYRDEDHGIAAIWNFACALMTEEWVSQGKLPAELNDLPRGVHDTEKERPAAAGSASGGD